jgi:hypothetical protein
MATPAFSPHIGPDGLDRGLFQPRRQSGHRPGTDPTPRSSSSRRASKSLSSRLTNRARSERRFTSQDGGSGDRLPPLAFAIEKPPVTDSFGDRRPVENNKVELAYLVSVSLNVGFLHLLSSPFHIASHWTRA